VETHRASIMKKTGAKSLPALARLALAAAEKGAGEPPLQAESSITVARRTART
jgi:two-component system, chemotaxis family, CheB/CheR fusion protein